MKSKGTQAVQAQAQVAESQTAPIPPPLKVRILKTSPLAQIPRFAHGPSEDAGMDLFSIEEVVLRPHVPVLVKTGLRMELPAGVQAEVRSRSGFALKEGVCVFNSPGTIDPGYRGDVGVILVWSGMTFNRMDGTGEMGFEKLIPAGSRVAQIVFMPYLAPDVEVAVDGESLSDSDRGEGGFGSTGV